MARFGGGLDCFEIRWRPKSWNARHRFIPVGRRVGHQNKKPIQPDLFQPVEYGCEFKVIVTNKRTDPRNIIAFHEGRGSQEVIPAELKTHCQMDYVPIRILVGNQLDMFAGILARNITHELQIPPRRGTTPKRTVLRRFRKMGTLRRNLVRRIGRIIRPAGKLVLSMSRNDSREGELRHALKVLNAAV